MIPELLLIMAFALASRARFSSAVIISLIIAIPLEMLSRLPIGSEVIALCIALFLFRKARTVVVEEHWLSAVALGTLYVCAYMFVKTAIFLGTIGGGWNIVVQSLAQTGFILISFALYAAAFSVAMMSIYALANRRRRR